jgi:hypothetical protein
MNNDNDRRKYSMLNFSRLLLMLLRCCGILKHLRLMMPENLKAVVELPAKYSGRENLIFYYLAKPLKGR